MKSFLTSVMFAKKEVCYSSSVSCHNKTKIIKKNAIPFFFPLKKNKESKEGIIEADFNCHPPGPVF